MAANHNRHLITSEWALAAALQTIREDLEPAIRRAYNAPTYEERIMLAEEALRPLNSVLATVAFAANKDAE